MKIKDYQAKAKTTAIYDAWYKNFMKKYEHVRGVVPEDMFEEIERVFKMLHICYAVLGFSGEVGELANKLKKVIRDDDGVMSDGKLKEISGELGDTMWYGVTLSTELGLDMNEVLKENIDKLFDRKNRNTLQGNGDNR